MTSIRSVLRIRTRLFAFLAASGLAIFGVLGAGSASADNAPAPPNYSYSTAVSAIGVQIAMQRQPDFSSLPDPFDAETPDSEAQLNSFGTSVADGHILNLNGLGGIPGLICLAAASPQFTCADIPVNQVTGGLVPYFPPPDPLDAHATYPHTLAAKAPLLGTQAAQASINQSGFALEAGAADATAQQYATSTFARAQNLVIPAAVTVGSSTTRTTQTATADGLTTTAEAHLSNVSVGGTALDIGGITTTSTVVSVAGKPTTDTTSTVLSDVTAGGLDATVDASGIHINKNALPANVVATAQQFINKSFAAAGIKVAFDPVQRSDGEEGHTVAAYGLVLTYDHTVKGQQGITVPALPCPPQLAGLPGINPCTGVSFSVDGAYHGQIALGQVGVLSFAQPGTGLSSPPVISSTSPPGSTPPPVGNLSGPPSGPLPSGGPGVQQGTGNGGPPPIVAPGQRNVADQLNNVDRRVKWFFPLFALGVFALIGRLRIPARLPGPK